MSELRALLEALCRRETTLDAARTALADAAAETPAAAADLLRLLEDNRHELGEAHFAQLAAVVRRPLEPVGGGRTVVLGESAGDDTAPVADRAEDDDATLLNVDDPSASDRTVVLGSDPPKADDATVTQAGSDDATPTGPADEATVVSAVDDATVVSADADAMTVNAVDDATVLNADSDATLVNEPPADGGFDILSDGAMAAAQGAGTGASWPTGLGAEAPGGGPAAEFGPGDVLKDRFVLESKLGEGGMGAVWKAKDKLKEEARDRNPYVAVKLLQGDFKEHPEAFIALQRETSKQQRLAHPNIATVYDFDRDGETVYMTMEVMEGEPMDSFIRKRVPPEGLTEEEAMPLIEDICSGLAYAHLASLVHSDLKPGNAFIVNDPDRPFGRVKLLDFGIARASKTQGEEEGEATVFDPGQLGALTPTYATVEMFDGQDPDPRDDIYALAIMAYQLFTGKHPYAKKSAPKAKELALTPDPIDKLDKRQNRGLARGLAFLRDDRTPTVEAFLDDVTKKKSRAPLIAAAALVLLVIIAAASYSPIMDYRNEQKREEILTVIQAGDVASIVQGLALAQQLEDPEQAQLVLEDKRTRDVVIALMEAGDEAGIREGLALIQDPNLAPLRLSVQNDQRAKDAIAALIGRGDEQSIDTGLDLIRPFDPDWQRVIMDHPTAKEAIIGLFTGKMYAGIDPVQGRYEYARAHTHLEALEALYPDSAEVFQIRNELAAHRQGELVKLGERYNALLQEGALLPAEDSEDVGDVLALVAVIEPQHDLLTDPRLAGRYAQSVREAMKSDDYPLAAELLQSSAAQVGDDDTLSDLRYQVEAELKRRADERLTAEIQQRLEPRWQALSNLTEFQSVRADLLTLAEISPANAMLAEIVRSLANVFDAELRTHVGNKHWARSEALLFEFASLLDMAFLSEQRARLSAAQSAAGYRHAPSEAELAALAASEQQVRRLLAAPELSLAWETALHRPYHELVASLSPGDKRVAEIQASIVELYLERAQGLRADNRFSEAADIIERGLALRPGDDAFATERGEIADAAEALRRQREEEQRLARIENLKQTLLAKAGADEPDEAKAVLAELATELAPEDPFMEEVGPSAIGAAYLRLAKRVAEREDFDAARALVRGGLAVASRSEELSSALAEYNTGLLELARAVHVAGADTTNRRGIPGAGPGRRGCRNERRRRRCRGGVCRRRWSSLASRDHVDGGALAAAGAWCMSTTPILPSGRRWPARARTGSCC